VISWWYLGVYGWLHGIGLLVHGILFCECLITWDCFVVHGVSLWVHGILLVHGVSFVGAW